MDQFKAESKRVDQAEDRNQLNLLRMIESRIVEIVQLEKDVKRKFPRLFQQRLPRFMRRRAASHNPARIPSWLRSKYPKIKSRTKLNRYRVRMRYLKHKRILRRHARHKFKDPNKVLLHKWFAKRFKMAKNPEKDLEFIPMHNNTKNFRNLYRQTRYGCAYISMAHLIAFDINAPYGTDTIETLNVMTRCISGFTFGARALESGKYVVVVHLYDIPEIAALEDSSSRQKQGYSYVCPAIVHNNLSFLTMWVPRSQADRVEKNLKLTKLAFKRIPPQECVRTRLVGPEAYDEAAKISQDIEMHKEAIDDVEQRLDRSYKFGSTIGRFVEEKSALFTYYPTEPRSVDIVFRNKRDGRMLWYKLVKNKAHLVGGQRDFEELLLKRYANCFQLKPDCD